jgi:hypothetical protein
MDFVLERTRDVDPNVRKSVFVGALDKVDIQALTIAQRESLLLHGCRDRYPLNH